MNLAICSCGLALIERRGARWCRHCDEVCTIKSGRCTFCRELNKVKG